MINSRPELLKIGEELKDRRTFFATLCSGLFSISGCGLSPGVENIYKAVVRSAQGPQDITITRSQINKIPYATLYAYIGKGSRAVLVLSKVNKQLMYWHSADRSVLVTRFGRLTQTAGLKYNLNATRFIEPDILGKPLKTIKRNTRSARLMDFNTATGFSVFVNGEIEVLSHELLDIFEYRYQTIHLVEHCTATDLDWHFDNHYWIDPKTGFIWQSKQYFTPQSEPLFSQVLKPYSG